MSFKIARGETYGLVGESGSGKSTAALALVRYLAEGAEVRGGSIVLSGTDVLGLAAEPLREFRSRRVSMVYQEPTRALNPTMRIGAQVAEALALAGRGGGWDPGPSTGIELLERVGLPNPDLLARRYPHQLSGGQAQRVVIAMALATRPELLILDEPTTGLDVQVEAAVLDLVEELRTDLDAAVLLISHNLPLVASRCDRVGVLENGVLVEEGAAREVLTRPTHDYTRTLVQALPDIDARKPRRLVREKSPVVISVRGLRKTYADTVAVAGVDLDIRQGEVVAIIGESGSGKTTLGRAIAGLTPYEGTVTVTAPNKSRHPVQMVFQSPDATLNPRRTVRRILSRAITLLDGHDSVEQLATRVGLEPPLLDRYPGELSGGQKQRVAIARAFAGPSALVVCDEPVSALDVSVQSRILTLLGHLQSSSRVSYLFISHDLAVVRALADRVLVMREGVVVESGPADQVYEDPQHPYTRQLIEAARYSALPPRTVPALTAGRPVTLRQ
ncbi:ATP-binding cassette domain-containing protein [Nocardia tengchongensis]|uniref:ATP-binding cassette domain-containing protein n=1 Tax=Nocardia tengchongensis TaxID=2055889 RepID=UPI003689BBF3